MSLDGPDSNSPTSEISTELKRLKALPNPGLVTLGQIAYLEQTLELRSDKNRPFESADAGKPSTQTS